jgi:hypothetical protein
MDKDLLKKIRGLLLAGDTESALRLIGSAIDALEISEQGDKEATARGKEEPASQREQIRESAFYAAKRLVEKAKMFLQTVGREIAFAEISRPKGAFVNDEMYVFVLDLNGMMLAHGENKDFIGLDFYPIRDLEGRNFIQEIIKTANERGCGSVEYIWYHPISGSYENKVVYFEKVDSIIICSGIYTG